MPSKSITPESKGYSRLSKPRSTAISPTCSSGCDWPEYVGFKRRYFTNHSQPLRHPRYEAPPHCHNSAASQHDRKIIYSAPTVQLEFHNFYSITMSWRDNNKSYQILTAAEKGTYGVLAAIVYDAPAPSHCGQTN